VDLRLQFYKLPIAKKRLCGPAPPTAIWRGSASAEKTVWWVAARKAVARCGIYSRSTEHRLNCFRDCSSGLRESPSLYQAVQSVYGPVASSVCRRGQGEKSKGTSDNRQVHHQRAAHHVGFVDQSHLTRHFKRVFGLPPNRLLSGRSPVIVV
jgi:AraC-like DNA-binding protein